MEYRVAVSPDGPWIEITIHAPVTAEVERHFATEAVAAAKAHDLTDFLVDATRTANIAETFEQYQFAYRDVKGLDLDKNARIAVLVSPGDASHDFIETLLRNAGFSCRSFRDRDAAYAWLREEA